MYHRIYRAASGPAISKPAAIGIGSAIGGLVVLFVALGLLGIFSNRIRSQQAIAEIERGGEVSPARAVRFSRSGRNRSVLQKAGSRNISGQGTNRPALQSNESVCSQTNLIARAGIYGTSPILHATQVDTAICGLARPGSARFGRLMSSGRFPLRHLPVITESPRSIKPPPLPENTANGAIPAEPEKLNTTSKRFSVPTSRSVPRYDEVETILQKDLSHSAAQLPWSSHLGVFFPAPIIDAVSSVTGSTRTERSKSVGAMHTPATVATDRPDVHGRSVSYGCGALGPAPTGPLPPIPPQKLSFRAAKEPRPRSVEAISPSANFAMQNQISLQHAKEELLKGLSQPVRPSSMVGFGQYRPQSGVSLCATFVSDDDTRTSFASNIAPSLAEVGSRLSVPRLEVADRMSISRVSSTGSLYSNGSARLSSTPRMYSTPRRRSGTRVSMTGSPAERPKSTALRSISHNASRLSRQQSNATASSFNSEDPNPFQWDPTLYSTKPSALKGSPRARKGHKRQNCVRISTLPPTLLGHASRSTSPSLEEIREESPNVTGFSSKTFDFSVPHLPPPSRSITPMSTRGTDPVKLRASLTPSSPTLSTTRYYADVAHHPSFNVPNNGSKSNINHSRESSLFSIPSLPSLPDMSFAYDNSPSAKEATDITIKLETSPHHMQDSHSPLGSHPPHRSTTFSPTGVLVKDSSSINRRESEQSFAQASQTNEQITILNQDRKSSLLGPRSQPAVDVRKSIMQLRRMNSDVQQTLDDTASRRYVKLGREASPLLGFGSLFEQDENNLAEDINVDAENDEFYFDEQRYADSDTPKGNGRTDVHSGFDFDLPSTYPSFADKLGQDGVFEDVPLSRTPVGIMVDDQGRLSSVWEDGEKFWDVLSRGQDASVGAQEEAYSRPQADRKARREWRDVTWRSEVEFNEELPDVGERTGDEGREVWSKGDRRTPAKDLGLRTPSLSVTDTDGRVWESPVAVMTPRSMYDADGFLRA